VIAEAGRFGEGPGPGAGGFLEDKCKGKVIPSPGGMKLACCWVPFPGEAGEPGRPAAGKQGYKFPRAYRGQKVPQTVSPPEISFLGQAIEEEKAISSPEAPQTFKAHKPCGEPHHGLCWYDEAELERLPFLSLIQGLIFRPERGKSRPLAQL
jgi:hypothetical protein